MRLILITACISLLFACVGPMSHVENQAPKSPILGRWVSACGDDLQLPIPAMTIYEIEITGDTFYQKVSIYNDDQCLDRLGEAHEFILGYKELGVVQTSSGVEATKLLYYIAETESESYGAYRVEDGVMYRASIINKDERAIITLDFATEYSRVGENQ